MKPTFLYRHYDEEDLLLYVGVSVSAVQRLCQHKELSPWFSRIRKITMEPYATREAALAAETAAIERESPVWNVRSNAGDSVKTLIQQTATSLIDEEFYTGQDYAVLVPIKEAFKGGPFTSKQLLENFELKEAIAKRLGTAPNPRFMGHLLKRLMGKPTPCGIVVKHRNKGVDGILWRVESAKN